MAKLNIKPGDKLTLTIRLDGRTGEDRERHGGGLIPALRVTADAGRIPRMLFLLGVAADHEIGE